YVAIAAIAMIAGPIAAFICGGAVEVLGFALHPGPGGYFPGFTITTMLTGLVMGCFFYRREIKLWRVIAARSIVVTVLHLGLNTFWLSMIYHDAFLVLLPGRIFKTVALLPLEVALILLTLKTVNIAVSRLAKHSNS
ncbi:MAG: folate family ECF transporter S component, partial [Clostridia bacterium]